MRPYTPSRYSLYLEPDLSELTFAAATRIEFFFDSPADSVVLDAVALTVSSVSITRTGDNGGLINAAWSVTETGLEIVPQTPLEGECTVSVEYTGEINDLMAGFYRSRYRVNGEQRFVGVTQFEERDARRAFPCIDEPGAKARFAISILAPTGSVAISNEAAERVEEQDDGRVLYTFAETPPTSTYLVFFAVGPFEITEDVSWRIPLRVAVSPGNGKYTQPALDYARQSISYLEEFTGVAYPLSKLDSIGVEDFAFGAMENFGAICYRENFLLDIPDTTTRKEREKQMGIAAHEMAHMWFGDIVSPAAWRYVWLNEAFATYLGNVVTDHWYPHWQTMDQFVITSQATAMGRDSHPDTIPIELDREEIEIDASTAPIIYQKGANLLRMLRAYYGDQAFTRACNAYLTEYQFSSATTEQFIESFGKPLGADSETDAARILESWVRQPGVPLIRARRDGDTLLLTQERFLLSGEAVAAAPWVIPVAGRAGGGAPLRAVLDSGSGHIDLPAGTEWVTLNSDQTGYYRVFYEEEADWHTLGAAAHAGHLSDLDRYGLLSDLAAFVNAGLVTLAFYLEFLERYVAAERGFVVLQEAAGALLRFFELGDRSQRIAAVGRGLLSPLSDRLLAPPSEDEPYENVLLRDSVLWALARFGDGHVQETLVALARAASAGQTVHPDLIPVAMRVWALVDDAALDYMEEQIQSPETVEARKVALIGALAGAARDGAADRVLAFVRDAVPARNLGYFLRNAASSSGFRERLWPWFTGSFSTFGTMHPMILGATIANCGAYGGIGRAAEVQKFISDYRGGSPRVDSGVLDLTLDRLAAHEALRDRL